MVVVEIEVPPRSAYVGVVRLATTSLARTAGFDEEIVDDLKIAVSEACTNAVLSNREAATDEPIAVTWQQEDGRVEIEVGDRGSTWDPDGEPGPDDSQETSTRLVLSMALLRSLVDKCDVAPRDGGGMSTRLTINR